MDSWDLLEPVDVLAKLPSTFRTDLESKKWTERKEAIESLLQLLADNPKLANNIHYDEIISTLTRVLEKDSNINVTSLVAKSLTGFAKGLRKKFGKFAPATAKVVFEKFKERKVLLRDPLIELIDALYATTTLSALSDEVVEAAGKPNPNIKLQLDLFLYRVFRQMKPKDVPKPLLKQLVPLLVKHAGEPDPEVRDAGCAALGAVMKCVGAQATTALLGSAFTGDKLKMTKVEEFCAKAAAEAKAAEEELAKESSVGMSAGDGCSSARSAVTGDDDMAAESTALEVDPWELLEPVDIVPLIARDFYTMLESKKWLERKDALDGVHQLLVNNPRLTPIGNVYDLVKALSIILRDDANINVAASAAKCITGLAMGLRRDFSQHAKSIVPIVLAKFKEKKQMLRDPLIACIDALFAATSLEAMADDLVEAASKPNPDIKIQVDQFLYRAFLHADMKTVSKKCLKDLSSIMVKHAADSSPDVRNASYAALGGIMKCVGQKAAPVLFGDLSGDKTKMSKVEEAYNRAMAEAPPPAVTKALEKPEHAADSRSDVHNASNTAFNGTARSVRQKVAPAQFGNLNGDKTTVPKVEKANSRTTAEPQPRCVTKSAEKPEAKQLDKKPNTVMSFAKPSPSTGSRIPRLIRPQFAKRNFS